MGERRKSLGMGKCGTAAAQNKLEGEDEHEHEFGDEDEHEHEHEDEHEHEHEHEHEREDGDEDGRIQCGRGSWQKNIDPKVQRDLQGYRKTICFWKKGAVV
jgi:hypothetical protein